MTWTELNQARHELGLTPQEMADLLGVSISTYKGWRTRGKIPPYIIASINAQIEIKRIKDENHT